MKKHLFFILCLMALVLNTIPAVANDYLKIHFKDGHTERHYLKLVESISTSKYDMEGNLHDDYQTQRLVISGTTYTYPLADIDSISYHKVDIEQVKKTLEKAMPEAFDILAECESIKDAENMVDNLKKVEGIEDAMSDGHTLHVKIKGWENVSFYFSHDVSLQDDNSSNSTRNISPLPSRTRAIKKDGKTVNAIIANLRYSDLYNLFYDLSQLELNFKTCNVDIHYPVVNLQPTIDFFYSEIYNYKLIFLVTHGGYFNGQHWYLTSTSLGESKNEEATTEILDNFSQLIKRYKDMGVDLEYGQDIEIEFVQNSMLGGGFTAQILVSDNFIKYKSNGHFLNEDAILFNGACNSLLTEGTANAFLEKGLGVYLGYTQSNSTSPKGGASFFNSLLLGKSVYKSYYDIPEMYRDEREIWNTFTNALLEPRTKMSVQNVKNLFLFPTYTKKITSEDATKMFESSGYVEIEGYATTLDPSAISMGFFYGTDEHLSTSKHFNSDNIIPLTTTIDKGNVLFKGKLTNLKRNTTYYYQAASYDGESYNQGPICSFTIAPVETNKLIDFEDPLVKEICVQKWDTNGDGELSMEEAAAVESLGSVFKTQKISSFNELQYFTGLSSIFWYAFSDCSDLTTISIPSSVTRIEDSVFSGCKNLTSITIPSSVNEIGDNAFNGCTALTTISIPNSVAKISDGTFYNCSNLTSFSIPNGVSKIGNHAFMGCSSLKSITIPNSVTSIGFEAFENCSSLTSVTIPNSVKIINEDVFCGCSSLTSITIPNSVTEIGNYVFEDCTGLTTISIPNSVTKIGNGVFKKCSSLTSITIPNSISEIGIYAFEGCTGLTTISIPNSITEIGIYAFEGCTGLTTISIPNSVTTIGGWAFRGCSGLTSVTIGNSVSKIGSTVFGDCSNLTDVYCFAENVPLVDTNVFLNFTIKNATLHVPAALLDTYKNKGPWKNFMEIVPIK